MNDLPIDADISPELHAAPPPQRQTRRGPRSQPARAPMRDAPRDGVWRGLDGEILTRQRTEAGDIFKLPPEMENDPEWEYQWNAVSVHGNQEVLLDQNMMMAENGWRPCPPDRPGVVGRFVPAGTKGSIIRGGQRLDIRPRGMCEDARAHEFAKAAGQMRNRDEALTGRKVGFRDNLSQQDIPLTSGYPKRGAKHALRMSIDHGVDIPRPEYELATGEE